MREECRSVEEELRYFKGGEISEGKRYCKPRRVKAVKEESAPVREEVESLWENAPGTGVRQVRGQHIFINRGRKRRELVHD